MKFAAGRALGPEMDSVGAGLPIIRVLRRLLPILAVAACAGGASTTTPIGGGTSSPSPSPSTPAFIVYWQSWSDTDPTNPYATLGSVPSRASAVDIAFLTINGNIVRAPENQLPLEPGAAALHQAGLRVVLSIGGSTSTFGITDLSSVIGAIRSYVLSHPGVFDGLDVDDEAIAKTGQQDAIAFVTALHQAFPSFPITWTAMIDGADSPINLATGAGEDRAVLQAIGGIVSEVVVMAYDAGGWMPALHPSCTWGPYVPDDCATDILQDFATLPVPGGTLGASRVVMGLMIVPDAPPPGSLTPQAMAAYAAWVRAHGFAGMMLWNAERDVPPVSGFPAGSYMSAIAQALGR